MREFGNLLGASMPEAMAAQKSFNAAAHFALVDIALWECSLKRYLDYLPAVHDGHVNVYFRDGVRAQVAEGETPEGSAGKFLRAFITLGTRGVYRPDDSEQLSESREDDTENVLFEIEATFLVLYAITREPAAEDLKNFARLNCMHNAWPFWRQHVFDTLKRASLPQITLPFFQMNGGTGSDED